MKKLSFINKIIFLFNNIFAVLLLLSYATPYIKPSSISVAPVLSLAAPVLILLNLFFIIYWILIGFKKQFTLSLLALLFGLFISSSVYKFGSKPDKTDNELSIMSYNVRKFNLYKWIDDTTINSKMNTFIAEEHPDILILQEYKKSEKIKIKYPHSYNPIINKKTNSGLAIFSKHPIINSGFINYNKRSGRAIYIDIIKNTDTIRIYNFHLQSLGVIPDQEYFGHKDSEKLLNRLRISFKLQEQQVATLKEDIKNCNYKIIVAGDMNNTAYSWVYKNLKGNLNDSFLEAGSGFGKTYNFKGFPLRIDYLFVDKDINIINHKNFKQKYSDHYPILTTLEF